ncbi:hypothetical protein HDU88_007985 [Geranomyces variabilis]|nr:hypothetical protein HDU88_007985 [Geranomyces variabilis]
MARPSASSAVSAVASAQHQLDRLKSFLFPTLLPFVHDRGTYINLLLLSKDSADPISPGLRAAWYAAWYIRAHDGDRNMALLKAARAGHLEACRFLIDAGSVLPEQPKAINVPFNLEPIFEQNRRDILAMLLDRGLRKLPAPRGSTPEFSAIQDNCCWDMLAVLIERGWKIRRDTRLDIAACEKGQLGVLQQLSELGIEHDEDLLFEAVMTGRNEIVAYVLHDLGISTMWGSEFDKNPLSLAACVGEVEMVTLLLDHNAAKYYWSLWEAMDEALHYGKTDVVEVLVRRGYSAEAREDRKMWHVSGTSLDHESTLNYTYCSKYSAWAVQFGTVELLQLILDAGTKVLPVDGHALRLAIDLGKTEMETVLRQYCDEPAEASPPHVDEDEDEDEDEDWIKTTWKPSPVGYDRFEIRSA